MGCFTVWFGGESAPKACQASLLEHFSELSDNCAPDWVMDRRLDDVSPEVPLVATRATIFSCDGIDEIAAWSQRHPGVLQRFSAFHFGVSSERWPRTPSTVSIPSTSTVASKAGSSRCGPAVTTSSPARRSPTAGKA